MTDTTVEQLTPYEHTRRALNRAATRIIQAWPHARMDANARGYTSSRFDDERSGTSEDTIVERVALTPDHATSWLAELGDILIGLGVSSLYWHPATIHRHLHDAVNKLAASWQTNREPAHMRAENILISRIITLANKAAMWWPTPPRKGTTVDGTTIGERGNTIETCQLCRQPVTGGHADPIRRIDGHAYHGKSCWFTARRGNKLERISA